MDNIPLIEAEEITFESEIDNKVSSELVKHNVTDSVIASLKEMYSGLKLASNTDTEGYLKIKEARLSVRKVEILGEKAFKKLKEYPNRVRNYILQKEKEFNGKFSDIYPSLDSAIKEYEDEKERVELEEKRRNEEMFASRQAALLKYGANLVGGSFVLGHISYSLDSIKNTDQDFWEEIVLPKYKAVFDEIQQALVEEEERRKQQAILLKEKEEEINRKIKLLEEMEAKIAHQEAAERLKKESEEREKLAVEEAIRKEREAVAERERQERIKAAEAEQRINEEIAQASDKEKWEMFLTQIMAVQVPVMKSPAYRKRVAIYLERMEEIKEM